MVKHDAVQAVIWHNFRPPRLARHRLPILL